MDPGCQRQNRPATDVSNQLYPREQDMQPRVYKVTFKTADYFTPKAETFFLKYWKGLPSLRPTRTVHSTLLSQYGYSTYKGKAKTC